MSTSDRVGYRYYFDNPIGSVGGLHERGRLSRLGQTEKTQCEHMFRVAPDRSSSKRTEQGENVERFCPLTSHSKAPQWRRASPLTICLITKTDGRACDESCAGANQDLQGMSVSFGRPAATAALTSIADMASAAGR